MKFGRKIPILLGGTALILIVLFVLSLAALQTSDQLTADSINSLIEERLAGTITSDTLKLDLAAQQLIIQKTAIEGLIQYALELRANRDAALRDFWRLEESSTRTKFGAEMAKLVQTHLASQDRLIVLLVAGKYTQAVHEINVSSTASDALKATTKEVMQWQVNHVAGNERKCEDNTKTTWRVVFAAIVAILCGPLAAVFAELNWRLCWKARLIIDEDARQAGRIAELSATVTSIAMALEHEATNARNIAMKLVAANVGFSEASASVTDSNSRESQTSQASREIAQDISTVDRAAGEMASGTNHVRTSAGELSTIAESLRVTVGRFHA